MKVWLVNPRTEGMISTELPGYVSREAGCLPPLGLLYLAAAVRARTPHAVRVLDMPAQGLDYAALAAEVRRERPELLGITAITHNLVEVRRAADCVKEASPGTCVCLGGPHVDAFPDDCLALRSLDLAIRGEAEHAFVALVEAVAAGADPGAIPGLVRRDGDGVRANPPAPPPDDLDALPFPARDLLDPRPYFHVLGKRSALTTLLSSRGCPFRCIFCSTPHGPCRLRAAARVVDEIEACLRGGAGGEFHFLDDTFNVRRGRLEEVSEELLRRGLDVRWSFRGRVDTLEPGSLRLARRAGCIRVHFGVETGTDEGLRLLRKQIDTGQVERALALAREAGVESVAYLLIGCPHERTREDVLRTVRFACRVSPDFALFNVLAIYPHTELMEMAVARGLAPRDLWSGFVRDPQPGFALRFWEEHFTRDELAGLLRTAYRRFYLRPSLVWRNLRRLTSLEELRHKAGAALALLGGRGP